MNRMEHMICKAEDGSLECLNCKATVKLSFPIKVNDFVGITQVFIKNHKDCKP